MKQLVVLSGKGGSGKTSVTASLAQLATTAGPLERSLVLVDADVDAANLALLVAAEATQRATFTGGEIARIEPEACIQCGQCEAVCRYDAITRDREGMFQVKEHACEGCAACYFLCPTAAISRQPRVSGEWFYSRSHYGPLFHAALKPGEENSGKLVNRVREEGRRYAEAQHIPLVLVDGPPGTGCPAIAAISQADHCLLVAEPTVAGRHDLERVLELINHFKVPASVCINKADLYPDGAQAIAATAERYGAPVLAQLPFDQQMTHAMVAARPITAYAPQASISEALQGLWRNVLERLDAAADG